MLRRTPLPAPADCFQWFIKPNCIFRGVTVAERGKGFLPSLLPNEDVCEMNYASPKPGCFSRAYWLCPRTWSLLLGEQAARASSAKVSSWLSCWKASGYVKSKAQVLLMKQAVQRFGLKTGSPVLWGHQYCSCGAPAHGAGGQGGTRADLIAVSTIKVLLNSRKSTGSCRASSRSRCFSPTGSPRPQQRRSLPLVVGEPPPIAATEGSEVGGGSGGTSQCLQALGCRGAALAPLSRQTGGSAGSCRRSGWERKG